MKYDHTITLVVPLDQLEIAKGINRHLDSDDVGGYDGFTSRVERDGVLYGMYSRPCDQSYADASGMLVTVPDILHAICAADSRFEVLPSIEDCTVFCAVAECYVDCAIEPYGFSLYVPPPEALLSLPEGSV